MAQQTTKFQQQCVTCQQTYYQSKECFVVDSVQDWHYPYMEYFIEGIWKESLKDAHNFERTLTKFFMDGGVMFCTSFIDEPLLCLSSIES